MLNQLTRSEPLIRGQFIRGGCQILDHGLFFHAQIGVPQFRAHFLRFDLIEASVHRDARYPVLERHLSGILRQFLKNLDENHLAKVLLGRSARTVRPYHFCNQRIKLTHQHPSCFIIMLKRSLNQRACIRIVHVLKSASTPLAMTGAKTLWLQFLV